MIKLPEGSRETLAKRKRNAKHYVCAEGLHHCVTSPVAIHYLDSENCLCDVDVSIPENLKITEAEHKTILFPNEVSAHYTSRKGGDVFIRLKSIDEIAVEELGLNFETVRDENILRWKDILPDLDIEVRIYPSGIEFFKILKGPLAPVNFSWEYRSTDPGNHCKIAEKTEGWFSEMVGKRKQPTRRDVEIATSSERHDGLLIRHETFTGRTMVKDPKTRKKRWVTDQHKWPVVIDAMVSENITAGADDVQENHVLVSGTAISSASLSTGGTKIRMGQGSYTSGGPTGWRMQQGGFRFQTVGIPAGSTVSAATFKLFKAGSSGTSHAFKVYIDQVDDAAAWTDGNLPNGITKFPVGGVGLNLNTSFGSPGAILSAGMTSAVQEILARPGWLGGQDMRFLCEPVYSSITSGDFIDVWSFEKTTNIPLLEITYTPPSTSEEFLWNVQKLVVNSTQALWDITTVVGKPESMPWNVFININAPATMQLIWDATGTAGNSLDAIWDVLSLGEVTQGFAFIHNPTRPTLNPKDQTVYLKGRKIVISLGQVRAEVASIKKVALSEIKATTGKVYAVGVETRQKQPDIAPTPDDDAILISLQILMDSSD